MRTVLMLALVALMSTPGPALAGFQMKGYAAGHLPDCPNLATPQAMEMNGDPSSPELVVVSCYNGQADVGMVELGSSMVTWIHFEDWSAPPEHIYYVDVDSDGLLDAVIANPGGTIVVGWSTYGDAPESGTAPAVSIPARAYSNPAGGPCQIAFSVSRPGPVSVTIVDASGRRVREILAGTMSSGFYRPHWDARDESGSPAPSGVYFARIDTADGAQSVKVVLSR
jgi:hypothetical protein